MQIVPIRPYNMSQKQNQQNTNFKGVAFKLDKSSPALLKYIDSCKEPLVRIEGYKKSIVGKFNKMQNVCNSFLPKILKILLFQYESEGLIDEKIDYEKLVKDIWPNDTEVTVQLKDVSRRRDLYNCDRYYQAQEFVGKSGNKEYTIADMGEDCKDIRDIIGRLAVQVDNAANPHGYESDDIAIMYNFTENMLKEQPGYKELIKTLEEKKAFKYSPEATEARRKTWLDDKKLSIDAKINRLLEALSPEEIEALKKQLL